MQKFKRFINGYENYTIDVSGFMLSKGNHILYTKNFWFCGLKNYMKQINLKYF